MPQPKAKQLKLSDKDRERLLAKIQKDWSADGSDLQARGERMARWYKLWRQGVEPPPAGEEEGSNFNIPLILWQILNANAKEVAGIFGPDMEIVVTPRGNSDVTRTEKIARYLKWRLKTLNIFEKYVDFVTLKRIYGKAICYLPWEKRTRTVKNLVPVEKMQDTPMDIGGVTALVPTPVTVIEEQEAEIVEFEGLSFHVENIEDWIVPKECTSLADADHFIRRLKLTVDDILDLKDQGKLDEKLFTEDFIDDLYKLAAGRGSDDSGGPGIDPGKPIREEKAAQSGMPTTPSGESNKIVTLNWTGKFRLKGAERTETIVAFYLPEKNDGELLGVCRLVDIFPDGRIPFEETNLIRDPKSFWPIGYCELLESINDEMNAIHNIVTDAGMNSVGPLIGYKPTSGFNPGKFKYGPFQAIPLADPANDVKALTMGQFNASPYVVLMPQLLAMAERLTGLTETQLGRQFSGPNAPRTYGQQALLQSESNQRMFLDIQLERETFKRIIARVWEADKRWLQKEVFFRVTEEDPMDVMRPQDFDGDFDFEIGPATAANNRGQMLQELQTAFAILSASPIAMQNPAMQAAALKKVLTKLGQPDIAAFVPDVAQLMPPQSAEQENVRIIQGEDVDPHPQDNHIRHISVHEGLADRLEASESSTPGLLRMLNLADTPERLRAHAEEHRQAQKSQGGSINMLGRGAPVGPTMMAGGPGPQASGLPSQQRPAPAPTDAGASPLAAMMASMKNQGGVNQG